MQRQQDATRLLSPFLAFLLPFKDRNSLAIVVADWLKTVNQSNTPILFIYILIEISIQPLALSVARKVAVEKNASVPFFNNTVLFSN